MDRIDGCKEIQEAIKSHPEFPAAWDALREFQKKASRGRNGRRGSSPSRPSLTCATNSSIPITAWIAETRSLSRQRRTCAPLRKPSLRTLRLPGGWPKVRSGSIRQSPEDSWLAVNQALRDGARGMPGGSSLARLLRRHGAMHIGNEVRGVPPGMRLRFPLVPCIIFCNTGPWRTGQFARACRPALGSPAACFSPVRGSSVSITGWPKGGFCTSTRCPRAASASIVSLPNDSYTVQAGQLRWRLVERSDVVLGDEPRGRDRLGRRKAELDVVQQELQRDLVLLIAAGHADRGYRPALAKHERGGKRNPWPLAGLDTVGMPSPGIETPQAAAQHYAGAARQHPVPAAGRGRYHVSLPVGNQAGGRVLDRSTGQAVRLGALAEECMVPDEDHPAAVPARPSSMSISGRRISAYSGERSARSGTSTNKGSA